MDRAGCKRARSLRDPLLLFFPNLTRQIIWQLLPRFEEKDRAPMCALDQPLIFQRAQIAPECHGRYSQLCRQVAHLDRSRPAKQG